jgi:hypothetical protein
MCACVACTLRLLHAYVGKYNNISTKEHRVVLGVVVFFKRTRILLYFGFNMVKKKINSKYHYFMWFIFV